MAKATQSLDDVIRSISQLQQLAARSSNPHEAAAAAAQAARLLLKFNLDADDITDKDEKSTLTKFFVPNLELRKRDFHTVPQLIGWQTIIAMGVQKSCMVALVTTERYADPNAKHRYIAGYYFLGRQGNVEIACYLFTMVCQQIQMMRSRLEVIAKHDAFIKQDIGTRTAWYHGAADCVAMRLIDERKQASADDKALVLVSRDKEANDYKHQQFPHLSPSRAIARPQDTASYRAGYRAGANVTLSKGLATDSRPASGYISQ